MARKKIKLENGVAASVPLSSMIDVVFLLLIYFIFTQKDLKKMEEIRSNGRYKIIRISLKDEPGAKVTNSTDRHGYYIYVKNQ